MSDPKWLDASGIVVAGYYWIDPFQEAHKRPGTLRIENLRPGDYSDKSQAGMRFLPVGAPAVPPVVPLPRSRTVELTARVSKGGGGPRWFVELLVSGEAIEHFDSYSKDEVIEFARAWGIEPEVSE